MVNTIAKIHISIAKYYKKLPKPRWKYIWPFQDWKPHLIILQIIKKTRLKIPRWYLDSVNEEVHSIQWPKEKGQKDQVFKKSKT